MGDDAATGAIQILMVLIDYPNQSWIVYYRDASGHRHRRKLPWYRGARERVEEIAHRLIQE